MSFSLGIEAEKTLSRTTHGDIEIREAGWARFFYPREKYFCADCVGTNNVPTLLLDLSG
jgi:hypothetical protein